MSDHAKFMERVTGEGVPAAAPQITQVQIGEALINPTWRGHLVVLADNGGDLIMFTIVHPRLGDIPCLWPRNQAAGIRAWLDAALQAPVMSPQNMAHPQAPSIAGEPQGTA